MNDIPAKAVTIVKSWHAWCTLCDWSSDNADSYQEANGARLEHLEEHRKAFATGQAAGNYQAQATAAASVAP